MLNYLAYMWAVKGINLDKAETSVNKALEQQPRNAAYLDTLGWILFKQNRYDEALSSIMAANADQDDPTIADHLGDTLNALDRTEEALIHWKRSFALDPDNDSVREKLESRGVNMRKLRKEQKARPRKAGKHSEPHQTDTVDE